MLTDIALGYAEKSSPGVSAEFRMETSGSYPLYLVRVSKFCPEI